MWRFVNEVARWGAVWVVAACVMAAGAYAADESSYRGVIYESSQGMVMETEEGDILHLVGMGLEHYAETVALVTGNITVTDGGDEVFVVTSVVLDDEAQPGEAGRGNLQ